MSANRIAQAGTLESNDIFIRISKISGDENVLKLRSIVSKQFGLAIEQTIKAVLGESGLLGVQVEADDRGALDCTIRARMEAAIERFRRMSA